MATHSSGTDAPVEPTERLASSVARRIEDDIIAMGWPVGRSLGSEAGLLSTYGVSRGVLREAIRLLEHKQVATMKSGPNGGLTISAPATSVIAETVANYFDFVSVTPEEIRDARRLVEVAAMRLAADRTSERSLTALRQAARAADPLPTHRSLADLARNPALTIVVEALLQASCTTLLDGASPPRTDASHQGPSLVEAFLAGELGEAESLLVAQIDDWSHVPRHDAPDDATATDNRVKLSERSARRIISDVRRSGAAPGEVIGSEQGFLARYEISRSVFRQTIRILEYYDLLHMRRGPGGGVIVGSGDPSHVVDAVITYLDFMRLDPGHLREARRVVEVAALHLAMGRLDDAGRDRLRQELEAEAESELGAVYKKAPDLHVLIGELSGNRPLAFFVRVLTRLQTSRIGSVPRTSEDRADIGGGISTAHNRLVDAMVAGDLGLARQRLRRHLTAMANYVAPERITTSQHAGDSP